MSCPIAVIGVKEKLPYADDIAIGEAAVRKLEANFSD
jgi:hypothetical protein